jgi:hypothetical protein
LLIAASIVGHRSDRSETFRPRPAPGRRQLSGQVGGGAKAHLVWHLATEGRMWHLVSVLLDEELHEATEPLDRIDRVAPDPRMLE